MRKVNVIESISLDGVIDAPGRPEEDTSGSPGPPWWIRPYRDPVSGAARKKQMGMPFDLLLGRLGKRKSGSDAHEARLGRCLLAEDIAGNIGR